jgi:hypothetical protein
MQSVQGEACRAQLTLVRQEERAGLHHLMVSRGDGLGGQGFV